MTTPENALQENGGYAREPSFASRLKRRFTEEIDTKFGDVILIGCFFVAGLIDSVAFNVYACFVSMQTGNTIFVGLGAAGLPTNQPSFQWTKSLTAIVAFLFGALFFSTFHRRLGEHKRWVVAGSFFLQTSLIIVAAVLVQTGVGGASGVLLANDAELERRQSASLLSPEALVSGGGCSKKTFPWIDLAPIALLAFQGAGQVVASRVLRYNAMPTVVLTTLYCDLMSDAHLLTAGPFEDAQRNRRAGSAVMLLAGAISGGWLSRSWVGFKGALWIGAAIKAVMVLSWVLWKAKPKDNSRQQDGAG